MDLQEKIRSDGKVEKKKGIDYEETFSPVAMLKSIRILLVVATSFNYKNWYMDVKTTFLNGNLEEDIYM